MNYRDSSIRFNISSGQRLALFLCATVLCMIIGSVIVALLIGSETSTPRLRVATIVQDIVMFILPAIITAIIATRYPARFLQIDRSTGILLPILAVITLIASIPAMNYIIKWNESISLPESLASLELWMRQSEESAEKAVNILIGEPSIGSFISAILIVGIMAGLSEELFFRGTLQRLLVTTPIDKHLAVWITAIIFSAIHMQFFGFVPRMLLGAYFGYLALYSGNLWIAVIAHVTNNTLAVISTGLNACGFVSFDADTIGTLGRSIDVAAVCISVLFTAALITITLRIAKQNKTKQ